MRGRWTATARQPRVTAARRGPGRRTAGPSAASTRRVAPTRSWRSSPTSRPTTGRCRPLPDPAAAVTPWHRRLLLKAMERLDVIDAFMRARVAFLVAGRERGYHVPDQELELAGVALDTCRAATIVVDDLLAGRLPTDHAFEVMSRTALAINPALDAMRASPGAYAGAIAPRARSLLRRYRSPPHVPRGSLSPSRPGRGHARRDVRPDHGVAGPRDHLGRGPVHPRRPRSHPGGRRAGLRPARAARVGPARAPLLGRRGARLGDRWTAGGGRRSGRRLRRPAAAARRPAPQPPPAAGACPPGRSS